VLVGITNVFVSFLRLLKQQPLILGIYILDAGTQEKPCLAHSARVVAWSGPRCFDTWGKTRRCYCPRQHIQRVSESTLNLTSDSSRPEQQNFYVSFFRNIIFFSVLISTYHNLILFFLFHLYYYRLQQRAQQLAAVLKFETSESFLAFVFNTHRRVTKFVPNLSIILIGKL
jgi:hypothetical protein